MGVWVGRQVNWNQGGHRKEAPAFPQQSPSQVRSSVTPQTFPPLKESSPNLPHLLNVTVRSWRGLVGWEKPESLRHSSQKKEGRGGARVCPGVEGQPVPTCCWEPCPQGHEAHRRTDGLPHCCQASQFTLDVRKGSGRGRLSLRNAPVVTQGRSLVPGTGHEKVIKARCHRLGVTRWRQGTFPGSLTHPASGTQLRGRVTSHIGPRLDSDQ